MRSRRHYGTWPGCTARLACRLHAVLCEAVHAPGQSPLLRTAALLDSDHARPRLAQAARHQRSPRTLADLRQIDDKLRDTRRKITDQL